MFLIFNDLRLHFDRFSDRFSLIFSVFCLFYRQRRFFAPFLFPLLAGSIFLIFSGLRLFLACYFVCLVGFRFFCSAVGGIFFLPLFLFPAFSGIYFSDF
jgi:hypothetical protein